MSKPVRAIAAALLLFSSSAAAARHRARASHGPAPRQERPKKRPPQPKTFPTACEVDQFLEGAPAMSPRERLPETITFMSRMLNARAPQDRDAVWIWEYFLKRWAVLFRVSGYMDMLEAVDQTPSDTRFSLSECGAFYRSVLEDTRAVEHYRYQSHRGRLAVCFEPEELERLLKLPVPGGRDRPRGLLRVSACDADALVDGLAEGGVRARRVEELVGRAGQGPDADEAGEAYLLTRLGLHFRAHPDEAILAGFDAATRAAPEARACELFINAVGTPAACAAFKAHYKKASALPARCLSDDVKRCLGD
ncbi:MAG TPA: hypothetical protein VHL80_13825 [Polyangia bacterium]|nr:hypothetical protein [Polyangia bacterium]